jgi:3-methylfumaryl-CoA hydratase
MADTEFIERSELLIPGAAEGLAGLLGVSPANALDGLPLLWHWCYLLERPSQQDLGVDGHPVRGTIPRPPGPGRRRMWAGGRVASLRPLHLGEIARRRTSVTAVTEKTGRSGSFTVMSVRHEIHQRDEMVIEERQDVVYRPDAPLDFTNHSWRGSAPSQRREGDWEVDVTDTLLFRFSALTYNAHRIHYDRAYARDVEGYPSLVVHGPLQVVLMAEAVRRRLTGQCWLPATFDYRLVSPLLQGQGMVVRASAEEGGRLRTTVHADDGRVTAQGMYVPTR